MTRNISASASASPSFASSMIATTKPSFSAASEACGIQFVNKVASIGDASDCNETSRGGGNDVLAQTKVCWPRREWISKECCRTGQSRSGRDRGLQHTPSAGAEASDPGDPVVFVGVSDPLGDGLV